MTVKNFYNKRHEYLLSKLINMINIFIIKVQHIYSKLVTFYKSYYQFGTEFYNKIVTRLRNIKIAFKTIYKRTDSKFKDTFFIHNTLTIIIFSLNYFIQ